MREQTVHLKVQGLPELRNFIDSVKKLIDAIEDNAEVLPDDVIAGCVGVRDAIDIMIAMGPNSDDIWRVCVQQCGASPNGCEQFADVFDRGGELRFQGDLGFGGKVHVKRSSGGKLISVWVSCYVEDASPSVHDMVSAANERIREVIRD